MKKDDHGFGTKAVHAGEAGDVQEGEKGVFLYTRAGNPTLIRISAGLEDAKDIITDLKAPYPPSDLSPVYRITTLTGLGGLSGLFRTISNEGAGYVV